MSSRSTPGVASRRAGADASESGDGATITPIGVDVGTRQLVTVASTDAELTDAVVVDGDRVRDLYAKFTAATHRLTRRDEHVESLGDVVWRYWRRFRREFRAAADAVVEYARRWPAPVVVLEDLPTERQPLVACRHGNVRCARWVPPVVQAIVAERVVDAGLPVTYVDPTDTSRACHRCGTRGVLAAHTLVCEAPGCPVDTVDRDRSAAVTIAQRAVSADV